MRKYWLWVVIIVQVLLIVSLVRSLITTSNANHRVEELEQKKIELENTRIDLENKKRQVQSEYYLEKVAREQLNLVKLGETVVIVSELEGEIEQEIYEEEMKSNWRLWLEVFLDID
jgi:cell division protein FtsB